ncbi:MAG TPA: hypothetical protein VIQ30_23040 [Pseudonocardia sp.]
MNLAQWWAARTRHPEPIEQQKAQSRCSREDLAQVVDQLHDYLGELKTVTAELNAITVRHGGKASP